MTKVSNEKLEWWAAMPRLGDSNDLVIDLAIAALDARDERDEALAVVKKVQEIAGGTLITADRRQLLTAIVQIDDLTAAADEGADFS